MEASPVKKRRISNGDAGSLPDEELRSVGPDEEEDEDDADEAEAEVEVDAAEKTAKGKRKKGGVVTVSATLGASGTTGAAAAVNPATAAAGMTPYTEYRYTGEIGQMVGGRCLLGSSQCSPRRLLTRSSTSLARSLTRCPRHATWWRTLCAARSLSS